MRMVAEYLEHAMQFEHMAAEAANEELKARLLDQARTYRRLADQRARRAPIKMPLRPDRLGWGRVGTVPPRPSAAE